MFSLKRTSGKVVLVADVEDLSVGVSIVALSKTSATILVGERMRLPIEDRGEDQSASAIVQLLGECADKVLKAYANTNAKNSPRPPHATYAILKSPWTRMRTAHVEEVFTKETTVTKDLIATLAKKALAETSDFNRSNILESGVMQVYLNGYPTGNPLGKRVVRAGVVAYESEVHPELKRGVIEKLGSLLPGRKPIVRSGLTALSSLLREHMPDIHRYVVLDVGGSTTTCSVFLRESVSQSAHVPEGTTTILKRISSAGLPEETLTQLRMLATDTCSTDMCKTLKDTLATIEPDLAKVFGQSFATLASKRRLPNNAMLSAPTELAPWLQAFFGRIDFSQFTATMQPLTVEPLTPDHLHDIVTWQSGIADTGIAIAAGYVNILEQSR